MNSEELLHIGTSNELIIKFIYWKLPVNMNYFENFFSFQLLNSTYDLFENNDALYQYVHTYIFKYIHFMSMQNTQQSENELHDFFTQYFSE